MKKCIILMCVVLMFCLTVCQLPTVYNPISSEEPESGEHTYILNSQSCHYMLSGSPEEVSETMSQSPWILDNYVSASVNKDGDLVLVLTDEHIKAWKEYLLSKFTQFEERAAKDGDSTVASNNYHLLVLKTIPKYNSAAGYDIARLVPFCGIMQMFELDDPNDWYVDIEFYDVSTGTLIKKGQLPTDHTFSVTKEDWEKALNTTDIEWV